MVHFHQQVHQSPLAIEIRELHQVRIKIILTLKLREQAVIYSCVLLQSKHYAKCE